MARTQLRSSGLFSGLVLISAGLLLLLHNYGDVSLGRFFSHWWPLLIIFWGVVKLYERTTGGRAPGAGGGAITGSEILLVIGMLLLIAVVVIGGDIVPGAVPQRAPDDRDLLLPHQLA